MPNICHTTIIFTGDNEYLDILENSIKKESEYSRKNATISFAAILKKVPPCEVPIPKEIGF